MQMQLSHARLLVEDVEASRTFYAEVLGLGEPVVAVPGAYYEFLAGPARLGVYARNLMSSVAGVAQAAPQDQAAWVLRVAHLRDPEGNLIEINAPLRK